MGVVNFFTIREVSCVTQDALCSQTAQDELKALFIGKHLFFIDVEKYITSSSESKSITLLTFSKKLPHTLQLQVIEEPILYVLMLPNSTFVGAGTQGSLKKRGERLDSIVSYDTAPVLVVSDTALIESISSAQTRRIPAMYHEPIKSLVLALKQHNLKPQSIEWSGTDAIRVSLDGTMIILDSSNPSGSIEGAVRILGSEDLTSLPKKVSEVDMRFKLPVLRTL